MDSVSKVIESAEECTKTEKQEHEGVSEKVKFRMRQEVDQYGDKLLKRLDEFRMKNLFYDVTLKTSDGDLAAHKVVLAACGGIFRCHFVDANTKKILSTVTEVTFECPADGLRTILKFAYSGKLEITQSNLLPTLLAAIATEMKEVQDICSEISISKMGWLLTFDGREETLSSLNENEKLTHKHEISFTLENAYSLLQKWLKINAPNFTPDIEVQNQSLRNGRENEMDDKAYPCLEIVEQRWPEVKLVYISVIDCLRKAAAFNKLRSHSDASANENADTESGFNKPDNTDDKEAFFSSKEKIALQSVCIENTNTKQSDLDSTITAPEETISKDNRTNQDIKAPLPAVRKLSAATPPKPPTSKPRTVSMKLLSEDHEEYKNEIKKQKPPLIPKEPPKVVMRSPASARTPQKSSSTPESSPSSSPVPPQRKNTSSKPRGPPPLPSIPPKPPRDTPPFKPLPSSKGEQSSLSFTPKVPPPRPKPPSINRKEKSKKTLSMTTEEGEKRRGSSFPKEESKSSSNPFEN